MGEIKMKQYLKHGKFRMLEALKSKLGNILDKKDWEILEDTNFHLVEHLFKKNFSDFEITSLEKNWAKENILKRRY